MLAATCCKTQNLDLNLLIHRPLRQVQSALSSRIPPACKEISRHPICFCLGHEVIGKARVSLRMVEDLYKRVIQVMYRLHSGSV